ncbi:MAG TPA: carboxypeptidase regulatory-like domain-containing protein, partial [Verrucomicrobiae bacterium]|nr:carboxypeptidase regulatory-like domain-containing protein [Verrucomicrobiae bacterium]
DSSNVNFTAVGLMSISGRIRTESGQALSGVTVTSGNRSAVTGPTGDYTITQVPSRTQVVTPFLAGYSFVPPSLNVFPQRDENGIDFTAYTSFQVSGRIFTSNSVGANAVTVTLRTNSGAGTPVILLSDTNGAYTFTNIRAGTYVVTPSKAGFGFLPPTNLVTLGPSVSGLSNYMFAAFTMSGRVTAGGASLAGATVILRTNGTEVARAVTGDTGTYSFNDYPAATYVLTPQLQGYQFAPVNRTVALAGNSNNLDFASSGTYSIRGRVTKDGTGLANVTIRAGGSVSISDATGNYALTNLPPGAYTVTADDPRYAMQPPSINLSLGPDQTNVDFRAVEVYTINGEVTEGAFPLAGVAVGAGGVTNLTTSNGRYTLARVPAGSNVVVGVTLPGYEFTPAQQSVVLDSIKNGVNFSARGLSSVSGRVIDAVTSNGLTRIKITVAGRYETFTTNGNYFLTNVGPGLVTVLPSQTNRGFNPVSRQVVVPTNSIATNVNFVSFRASKLFGRITFEETTNGIPNVTVRAEGNFTNISVSTDADGNYIFPSLRNDFYKLTPSKTGQGFDPQSYDVDLTADARRDFVAFPGFSISGRVIDANTLVGIPDIQVNVNTPQITPTLTDTNGFFNFTGLREGDYTVTPLFRGYDMSPTARQLSLGPTNATSVTFLARGNLTIIGRVLEGSTGISNIQVSLIGTNMPGTNTLRRTASSDGSGRFLFTNLPPGTVTVQPVMNIFTPTNYVLDTLAYDEPVFRVATRLSISRSTNGLKITLRGLPLQTYTLQTNVIGRTNWVDHRPALTTDANGMLDYFPSTNSLSAPTLLFRSRR